MGMFAIDGPFIKNFIKEAISNNDPRLLPKGTRVVKWSTGLEEEEHKLGSKGTIAGGIYLGDNMPPEIREKFKGTKAIYIVIFDRDTDTFTFLHDWKIKPLE